LDEDDELRVGLRCSDSELRFTAWLIGAYQPSGALMA